MHLFDTRSDPDAPPPLGLPTFLHWIRRGLKAKLQHTPATDGGSDVRPIRLSYTTTSSPAN